MRGSVVLLESLGVGRCFTLPVEPGAPAQGGPGQLRTATPILAPDQAWKVAGEAEGGRACESASGLQRTFPAGERVVEIPRQGWDKLRERRS